MQLSHRKLKVFKNTKLEHYYGIIKNKTLILTEDFILVFSHCISDHLRHKVERYLEINIILFIFYYPFGIVTVEPQQRNNNYLLCFIYIFL